MRIVFLGTNGWYSSETGDTLCVAVETEKYNLILDAGNGIRKLDKYLDLGKETLLFLSHYHLDHIIGMHILHRFGFRHPLRIVGPPGIRGTLNTIMRPPFAQRLEDFEYEIELIEAGAMGDSIPFPVRALPLVHVSPCYGYRFEIDGVVLAFCTDTGPCENLSTLARGADCLILECSLREDRLEMSWPHLGPVGAAEIARKAGARRLLLSHFEALSYATIEDRYESERRARAIFASTDITRDGSEFFI
jgi:ribonuclease BN (tRNA processing enzyme)